MTIQSVINKKAWNIRRNAAKRFSCNVMEISWKECILLAKEGCIKYLDYVVKRFTCSSSFSEFLNDAHTSYNPTIFVSHSSYMLVLANAFDNYMQAFGKPNRAWRI